MTDARRDAASRVSTAYTASSTLSVDRRRPAEIPARSAVQQHGVFRRRREHAAFFETDDEEVRTAGIAGLGEGAGVEMSGARTLGGDVQRLHPLADEAQRLCQPAGERAERAQLAKVILQRCRGPMVQRVAASGVVVEKIEHAGHHGLQGNLAIRRRFRHRPHQADDPVANAGGLPRSRRFRFRRRLRAPRPATPTPDRRRQPSGKRPNASHRFAAATSRRWTSRSPGSAATTRCSCSVRCLRSGSSPRPTSPLMRSITPLPRTTSARRSPLSSRCSIAPPRRMSEPRRSGGTWRPPAGDSSTRT